MFVRCFIFLLALQCFACKKDNVDDTNYQDEVLKYAPFQKGSTLIYKVDSTYFNDFKDTSFTITLYRKYSIDSLDNGIKGRTLFRVVVSEANDSLGNYSFKRVDQWAITAQYFETQVHNQRFTHLIFPANFESTWNVHEYSNLKSKLRYYTALSDTFKMGAIVYDSALKVENEPRLNSVINESNVEVYVKKIGLVYKKIVNIETQFGLPNGTMVTEKLYDYQL